MVYKEEKRDLFTVPEDYYFAHCISADFALGAGIAVEFTNRFDMKKKLQSNYPFYLVTYQNNHWSGDCIIIDNVFNLITKECYWQKPTYESVKKALECCKMICKGMKITKLAMPKIGCGLDKLEWNEVSRMIKDIFNELDIEIVVCYM